MAPTLRATYHDLTTLAGEALTGSQELGDAAALALEAFPAPEAAFGDTPAASLLYEACQRATESTGSAADTLVGVLEGDVDRLYQVAFTTQATDGILGQAICALLPTC